MQDTVEIASEITWNESYERSGIETLLMMLIGLALTTFGVKSGWASDTHGLTQAIMLSFGIVLSIAPRRCVSVTDRYVDWILATISASGLVLMGFAISAFAYAQLVNAFAPLPFKP
jgi:hypothetical protein